MSEQQAPTPTEYNTEAYSGQPRTKKRGRPSKLTPELIQSVTEMVADGNFIETACVFHSITSTVWRDWIKQGVALVGKPTKGMSRKDRLLRSFSLGVKRAMAASEADDLSTIKQASKRSWQAAGWRLERKFPDKYGQRTQTQVSGTIKHEHSPASLAWDRRKQDGEVIDITSNQEVIEE